MTRRPSTRTVLVVGAALSLMIAGVLSGVASASPGRSSAGGADARFADSERESATSGSPLADYVGADSGTAASPEVWRASSGWSSSALSWPRCLAWLRRPRSSDEER